MLNTMQKTPGERHCRFRQGIIISFKEGATDKSEVPKPHLHWLRPTGNRGWKRGPVLVETGAAWGGDEPGFVVIKLAWGQATGPPQGPTRPSHFFLLSLSVTRLFPGGPLSQSLVTALGNSTIPRGCSVTLNSCYCRCLQLDSFLGLACHSELLLLLVTSLFLRVVPLHWVLVIVVVCSLTLSWGWPVTVGCYCSW